MTRYHAYIRLTIDTDTEEEATELASDVAGYAQYDSDCDGFAERGVSHATVQRIESADDDPGMWGEYTHRRDIARRALEIDS